MSEAYQYDGTKNGDSWKRKVKSYWISKCPDALPLLDYAESLDDSTLPLNVMVKEADSCRWMIDINVKRLSEVIWGFMNTCLTGRAHEIWEGADPLNGFDAWRRIVHHIHKGAQVRLGTLRRLVKNPPMIKRLEDISEGVVHFEAIMKNYRLAGGSPPEGVELKNDFLETLPSNIRELLMWRATEVNESFEAFTRHVCTTANSILFHQSKNSSSINLAEEPKEDDDEYEREIMAINKRFPGRPRLAFQRKPGGGGNGDNGGRRPANAPPGDRPVKCANCGGPHQAVDCPKPKVELKDRPCHNCGKIGHMSRHCPERRKAPIRSVEEPSQDPQADTWLGCVTSTSKPKPRPRQITLADHITPKSFAHKNKFHALADESPASGTSDVEPPPAPVGCRPTARNRKRLIGSIQMCPAGCQCDGTDATHDPIKNLKMQDIENLKRSISENHGKPVSLVEKPVDLMTDSVNLLKTSANSKNFSKNSEDKDFGGNIKNHEKVKTLEQQSANTLTVADIQAQLGPRRPDEGAEGINMVAEVQRPPAAPRQRREERRSLRRRGVAREAPELVESSDDEAPPHAEKVPEIDKGSVDSDDDPDSLETFIEVIRKRAKSNGVHGNLGSCWSFGDPSVNVIDEESSEQILAATEGDNTHKIFVTLDSGAVAHCASPRDLPGTIVVDKTTESRRFVGANGETITHWGNAKVRLQQSNGNHMCNIFQVMDVCRPLHSVSMIADQGYDTVFTKTGAVVIPAGALDHIIAQVNHVATYKRMGGLYVAEVIPKDPAKAEPARPFAGQGRSR